MSVPDFVVLALALLVAAGRLTVPTRPAREFGWPLTYEALAHLIVGGLVGYAAGARCWLPALLALGLTLFEAVVFLVNGGASPRGPKVA